MPTSRAARHLFFFALLVACLTCTIHAKETTAELLVSDFLLAGDEIELPSSSAPSVLVTEIQFGDRAGGPDWLELFNSGDEEVDLSGVAVEILSGEEDEASLDGNETGKWIDAVNCEGKEPGRIGPGEYVVLAGPSKKPGAALAFRSRVLGGSLPPSLGGRGACGDVRPEGSSGFSCDQQRSWGKCLDEWMVRGGFCEKTCGRCESLEQEPLSARSQRNGGAVLSSCVLAAKLGSSGELRVVSKFPIQAVLDRAAWSVAREDAEGYTVGRVGETQKTTGAVAALEPLLAETPGRENAEGLSFGPLGPHWAESGHGGPRVSRGKFNTVEENFKSNLPIAVIKTQRWIPDDPKTRASLWLSACEAQGRGGSDLGATDALRNRKDLVCSFFDAPAYDGNAGIELRGRSSQRYPKKQYGMEFWDETGNGMDVAALGLPAEEDWVLGAPYVDRSLMRDPLAFDMYRSMGRWAPAMEFIELFLMEADGRSQLDHGAHYKGIYSLKEKIKRSSKRVAISKMDPTNATDVEGGYLLVMSSSSHDGMLNTGGPQKHKVSDLGPARVKFVYPKVPTPGQSSYISNYLESFQRALWGPQFSHPTEGYAKYIDVDSFVDYFLHTESTKNLDGYISSVYLSKDEGGKLTAGPAWDYNLAYGQAAYWDGYYREPWGFTHVGPNQKRYSQMVHWYYRLLQDPSFVRRVRARYEELRRGPWSREAVKNLFDEYAAVLGAAQGRNFARWPINHVSTHHKYIPIRYWGDTWGENVRGLEEWVLDRLEWMDEWVPQLR